MGKSKMSQAGRFEMNETEECRDKPDLQNVQIHCLYRHKGGWSSSRIQALPWRGRGCEPGIFCLSLLSLLSSTLDHSATVPLLFVLVFLKVVTTLVDLLFIELMSYLSHVKQMYSQPIHLTQELKLCKQITRGREEGYILTENPCLFLYQRIDFFCFYSSTWWRRRPRCTSARVETSTVTRVAEAPSGLRATAGRWSPTSVPTVSRLFRRTIR